jgi:hypothetical protein
LRNIIISANASHFHTPRGGDNIFGTSVIENALAAIWKLSTSRGTRTLLADKVKRSSRGAENRFSIETTKVEFFVGDVAHTGTGAFVKAVLDPKTEAASDIRDLISEFGPLSTNALAGHLTAGGDYMGRQNGGAFRQWLTDTFPAGEHATDSKVKLLVKAGGRGQATIFSCIND